MSLPRPERKPVAPPYEPFMVPVKMVSMTRSTSVIGRDRGLQARMLMTMFLLGALYVAFMGVLFAAGAGAVTIVALAGGMLALQYFASDKIALASMGAREASPKEAPELHQIVERLCLQADLPKPRIAMVQSAMPNAFALGRSPKHATVCATSAIVELLSPSELEGVIAHELTHVANRDVAIMTLASFFASLAAMIMQFGFFFGGGGDDDENAGFFLMIVAAMATYVISFVLMQALSRYREFAADRGAAVLTGRPSALASALLKISQGMERVPTRDLRHAEMNAFYIFPAKAKRSMFNIFSTHPPIEQRIARLERMESELQGTAGSMLPAAA